jgi:DNA-binding LacI/PurR family transcriptional regulator
MEIHVKSKYKTRPIIGMFINNLFNEYSFLIHKGVKTKVYDSGGILICLMGGSLNNPFHSYNQRGAVYNLAQSKSLDGLIILSSSIGSYIERKHYESFINTFDPLPIVNIGKIIDGYFNVKANNYHSMCELVTHCIKKHGCKKIAMIKGPEKN